MFIAGVFTIAKTWEKNQIKTLFKKKKKMTITGKYLR